MNKKTKVLLVAGFLSWAVTSKLMAAGAGFYLGAEAGLSKLEAPTLSLDNGDGRGHRTVKPSTTGGGGRAFLGYNFNPNFGLEAGYVYLSPATYNIEICPSQGNCGNPLVRSQGIDFFGKGMLGGFCGFDLFVRGGFAIMRTSTSGSLKNPNGNLCGDPNSPVCSNTQSTSTKIQPAAGVGISYDFNPNIETFIEVIRYFKSGSNPTADLAALGISFHFVEQYCGQFLC